MTPPQSASPTSDAARADALRQAREEAARRVEDLRSELAAIGEATEAGPDDEHDAEGPTVGYERARVTGLLEQAERALQDAERATARVDAGTYGVCTDCGAPIAQERLAALPATQRCGACAQRAAGRPGRPRFTAGPHRA